MLGTVLALTVSVAGPAADAAGIRIEPLPGVTLQSVDDGPWWLGAVARRGGSDAVATVELWSSAEVEAGRGALARGARPCPSASGLECFEVRADLLGLADGAPLRRLLARSGALARARGPFHTFFLVAGRRIVTIASTDRALARALRDATRADPAEADPRAEGCYAPEGLGVARLCLRPGGALIACRDAVAPARCPGKAGRPGGWATRGGVLAVHVGSRTAAGPYVGERDALVFRGARWAKVEDR